MINAKLIDITLIDVSSYNITYRNRFTVFIITATDVVAIVLMCVIISIWLFFLLLYTFLQQ